MGKKLLLNLPEMDVERMEEMVSNGQFSTKTDLVRFALKKFLYSDDRMASFQAFAKEVQAEVKRSGLTKKDIMKEIEEAKEGTRREVRRMLKELHEKERRKRPVKRRSS